MAIKNVSQLKEDKPRFLQESTQFFGRKGAGKTAFMKAVKSYHINDRERFEKAKKVREERGLTPFPQNHCCFSNIPDKQDYYGGGGLSSYAFDPFKFMIPNSEFVYKPIIEYGVYDISEGQRYYNSYNYKSIPIYVLTAFENARAMNVIINIDVQRPIRIASSIREITVNFCRPVKLEVEISDFSGRIIRTILHYIEFESFTDTEEFLQEYGENEKRMLKHPKLKKYVRDYNVFDTYDSFQNKEIFYKNPEEESMKKDYGDFPTFEQIKNDPNFFQEFWKKQEKTKEQT